MLNRSEWEKIQGRKVLAVNHFKEWRTDKLDGVALLFEGGYQLRIQSGEDGLSIYVQRDEWDFEVES